MSLKRGSVRDLL